MPLLPCQTGHVKGKVTRVSLAFLGLRLSLASGAGNWYTGRRGDEIDLLDHLLVRSVGPELGKMRWARIGVQRQECQEQVSEGFRGSPVSVCSVPARAENDRLGQVHQCALVSASRVSIVASAGQVLRASTL